MKKWVHSQLSRFRRGDGELLGQGLLVLIDQSGYSAISLLSSILLARACGKEPFGIFVLCMTFVFFAKVIQRSLVSVPFSVLYPRLQGKEQKTFLGSALVQHTGVTLLLVLGLWPAAVVTGRMGGAENLGNLFGYFAGVLVSLLTADFVRTLLLAQFRYFASFVIGAMTQTVLGIMLLVFYCRQWLDIRSACVLMCTGYGLFVIAGGILLKGCAALDISVWGQDFRKNYEQGRWILSGTFLNYAGVHLLPWITLLWWDSGVVAVAGVLGMVSSFLRPVMQSMIHFLIPRFADTIEQKGFIEVRRQTLLLVQMMMTAGVLLSLILYRYGDPLVGMVYGSSYCGYAGTLTVFSAAAFLRAANAPLRSLLTATEQSKQLVTSSLYATVLCIVTAFLWIPRYGVTGYACAYGVYTLSTLVINTVQAFAGEKQRQTENRIAAA